MSEGYIIGSSVATPATTATRYNFPHLTGFTGGAFKSWDATRTNREVPMPTAGVIDFFHFRVTTAPGSGKSWVFTIVVNGVDSNVTVTISGTATEATDSAHSVSFSAGDLISIKSVPSGTPSAPGNQYWNIGYTPTTTGEQILIFGSDGTVGAGATNYNGICNNTSWLTTEQLFTIVPTPGSFSKLYLKQQFATGASKTNTYTLRKNLADATNVVALSGGSANTGQDTTHSDSFAAGDRVSLKVVTASAIGVGYVVGSIVFTPSTSGELIYMYCGEGGADLSATSVCYEDMHGSDNGGPISTVEGSRKMMFPAGTLKKYYGYTKNVAAAGSPGSGKSYTFKIRQTVPGGSPADSGLTFVIEDLTNSDNDTTNTAAIADGDYLEQQITPSGTPTARAFSTGIVLYLAPVGGNNYTKDLSDTVGNSETLARSLNRALNDSVSKSETLTKVATLIRSYNETMTIVEAMYKQDQKVLSDSENNSDSIIKTSGKTFNNTVGNSEALSKIATLFRSYNETVGFSEVIVKIPGKVFNNTQGNSDNASIIKTYLRSISDQVSNADTIAKFIAVVRLESVGHSEVVLKYLQRTLNETKTVLDSILSTKTQYRTYNETVGNSEVLGRVKTQYKTLTDTVNNAEAFLKSLNRSRSESVTVDDSVVATVSGALNFMNTLIATDSIIKQLNKTYLDTLSLNESLIKQINRVLLDSSDTEESFSVNIYKAVEFLETISNTDNIAKYTIKSLNDVVLNVSQITISSVVMRTFSETVSNSEVFTRIKNAVKNFSDSISNSDSISKFINKSYNETVVVVDKGLKKFLNGIELLWEKVMRPIEGVWNKLTRPSEDDWTRESRPSEDDWTKNSRPSEGTWSKESRPSDDDWTKQNRP